MIPVLAENDIKCLRQKFWLLNFDKSLTVSGLQVKTPVDIMPDQKHSQTDKLDTQKVPCYILEQTTTIMHLTTGNSHDAFLFLNLGIFTM